MRWWEFRPLQLYWWWAEICRNWISLIECYFQRLSAAGRGMFVCVMNQCNARQIFINIYLHTIPRREKWVSVFTALLFRFRIFNQKLKRFYNLEIYSPCTGLQVAFNLWLQSLSYRKARRLIARRNIITINGPLEIALFMGTRVII